MTAPPGGGLDVGQVLGQLCGLNLTSLMQELNTWQQVDKLEALVREMYTFYQTI